MRIIDAKAIVCSPGRNFVTLKITTEDGVYGLGDATLNGRELAVAGYLTEHVIPLLIGRDARRIEDTWPYRLRNFLRDLRRRYGIVGHQGQDPGCAGLSIVGRRVTRRGSRLRTRERR